MMTPRRPCHSGAPKVSRFEGSSGCCRRSSSQSRAASSSSRESSSRDEQPRTHSNLTKVIFRFYLSHLKQKNPSSDLLVLPRHDSWLRCDSLLKLSPLMGSEGNVVAYGVAGQSKSLTGFKKIASLDVGRL